MKTVRRLYFYAVALISLEVVLWGLIGLLRTIVNQSIVGAGDALAQALALVLVGVPIFLIHWLWAQRAATNDDEEKSASLRAIFFYAALIGTLVPVIQNLLALVDRLLLIAAMLPIQGALLGGSQSWSDNLIAIAMNLIVAAYFWNTLRGEWKTLTNVENFADVRRLYRYLWLLYGLLMTVFGAQQLLRFVFYVPTKVLGGVGLSVFVNGLALLIVGAPLWVYVWRICQDALVDSEEMESNLRLGVLYVLSLAGVITVLSMGGDLLNIILQRLLGETSSWPDFIQSIGGPISIGVPLAGIWAYYGRWLNRHIESSAEGPRRDGLKRPYAYILSLIGLVTAFTGVALLISIIIDLLTGQNLVGDEFLRSRESAAIATLLIGLPLWLSTWLPVNAQADAEGDTGEHARRSVVRKAYLYLVLFAAVIGGMSSAVALVFRLLSTLLTGSAGSNFLTAVLNFLQLLVLFVVVLIYHLSELRHDGESTAGILVEKQAEFAVMIFDAGDGRFGEMMRVALNKHAPRLPVLVVNATMKLAKDTQARAVVLPGSLAVNPPETISSWLNSFSGSRLIVPDEADHIVWANDAGQAALAARQLAEGQEVRIQKTKGASGWTIVIYIGASLFALQILFFLLAIVISTLFR
ncbi:MAG TPA: DUF5671 domain-containing protein [Anaerolineales bacterium]|nr:DUF5671 domain-containing protein [Anaerolineales bacterium]